MVAIEIEEMYKVVGVEPIDILATFGYYWTMGLENINDDFYYKFDDSKQMSILKLLLKHFNHTSLHKITRTQYTFNILEEVDKKFNIKYTAFGKFDIVLAKMVKLVWCELNNEQQNEIKSVLEGATE